MHDDTVTGWLLFTPFAPDSGRIWERILLHTIAKERNEADPHARMARLLLCPNRTFACGACLGGARRCLLEVWPNLDIPQRTTVWTGVEIYIG